jgi:hypothetical protein
MAPETAIRLAIFTYFCITIRFGLQQVCGLCAPAHHPLQGRRAHHVHHGGRLPLPERQDELPQHGQGKGIPNVEKS